MATHSKKARPLRTLVVLGILVVALFGSILGGNLLGKGADKAEFVPKFALDLEGGTQLVLTPQATNGKTVTSDDISQAIEIIRSRIDSSGVSEAEITRQGSQNIVVGIPGSPSDDDLDLVTKSARMTFRTVLSVNTAAQQQPQDWMSRSFENPTPPPSPSADPSASADADADADADAAAEGAEAAEPSASASATPSPLPSPTTKVSEATGNLPVPPDAAYAARLTAALDDTTILTDDVKTQAQELNCDLAGSSRSHEVSDPDKPLVTCSDDGSQTYVLGPVMVEGSELTQASSGQQQNQQGNTTGVWAVNIEFNNAGTKQFAAVTEKLYAACQANAEDPKRSFAIVLDDLVLSAPQVCTTAIKDGRAEITGSFTQKSAKTLSDQLSFGSLPIEFREQSRDRISATAGSEQLTVGLWAGLIGLILVALYSFFQYRALSFVTVLSLVFGTGLTYGLILLLSWTQNYRLSLAGVAGIIVSVGITADSFIVYFERIRDELRVGRSLDQAVALGWVRARRTILASDAVNFIAAIVLYIVAVGGVRGFAFTLGLTTVMDLVVVICFTHPMLLLLTKTEFFGNGHPWSGLDPHRLGAPGSVHYSGRGRVTRVPDAADGDKPGKGDSKAAKVPKTGLTPTEVAAEASVAVMEAEDSGMSIAERKRARKLAEGGEK